MYLLFIFEKNYILPHLHSKMKVNFITDELGQCYKCDAMPEEATIPFRR